MLTNDPSTMMLPEPPLATVHFEGLTVIDV
jgi:hypothetical protein